MKPRFQPDVDPNTGFHSPESLVDPEAYDASEQQFAATLEQSARPMFEVDSGDETLAERQSAKILGESSAALPKTAGLEISEAGSPETPLAAGSEFGSASSSSQNELPALTSADPDAWRREVAARLNRYKSRRRAQAPRYPSLQLKFESPDASWTAAPGLGTAPTTRSALAMQGSAPEPAADLVPEPVTFEVESSAKVLEFPRQGIAAHAAFDELAGPVLDRPRILEVPEMLPPPPALGGILIEQEEDTAGERRPGFELPLQAAPMGRRALASAIDVFLVVMAFSLFAYIFFRLTGLVPPLQQAAEISLGLIATFWAGYQYLLLVYAGTTPGLKLVSLRLSRFDGTAVPRRLRQWRVLASILSGLSLALGYAWCFLDEDHLCWHDRITRTYMAPGSNPAALP